MKQVAVCTLSQSKIRHTGLLSWFSQLARFLPTVDPDTRYRFALSEGTRDTIVEGTKAEGTALGWDSATPIRRMLSEHLLLGRWIRAERIDTLLMANAGSRPLYLPRKTRLVQAIYGFHHDEDGSLPRAVRLYRQSLFNATVRRADVIVVNSDYSLEFLQRLAPEGVEKAHVIPHGVNSDLFNSAPVTPEDSALLSALGIESPYVAFVSKIYPYKNVHTAVEGYCQFIRTTGLPHKFVIVGTFDDKNATGETYRSRLIDIARSYGLEERLQFIDSVSVRALRALYCSAAVYVQPSLSETFGRTSLEAMACGCPVVAARAAATPEVLGDAGYYFDGTDVAGCAEMIAQAVSGDDVRTQRMALGLERAGQFTIEQEARQLFAVM